MKTLVLDATTKSLSLVLAGAKDTNDCDIVSAWADSDGTDFTEGSTDLISNGTTPVTVVASPAASTRRIVKSISVYNADLAAVTINISLISASGTRLVAKVTLAVGDTWTIEGTYDTNGNLKVTTSTSISKATGAEIDTGTDDAKYVTPKAIADSDLATTSDITGTNSGTNTGDEVVATGAEIDTGTDNEKMVTPKAVEDSSYTKSALPLAGGTMTGDIQLGETDIKLDAVLSGDEKWSGVTMSGTAGATLAVGDVCFLQTADSKWELVDGILDGTDVGFKLQLGICVLAANADAATEMLVYGKVRSAAFPAFTVGAPVYLSDTAGDLVVAQPSSANFCIRVCGYAISATDLLFNPDNSYIVHT